MIQLPCEIRKILLPAIIGMLIVLVPTLAVADNSTSLNPSYVAWADFCDRMKSLGEEIMSDDYPASPADKAEGIRHISRLMREGLEWEVENTGGDHPVLMRSNDNTTMWGGPNTDNTYLRAHIDGSLTYRLSGNVSTLHNFIVSAANGDMQQEKYNVIGDLDKDDLQTDADGNFELIISPVKHEGPWLKTTPEIKILTIRTYYTDWNTQRPAEFHLEKVGTTDYPPLRPTPDQLTARLNAAADWVETSVRYWNTYQKRSVVGRELNTMSKPGNTPGGSAQIFYAGALYDLADDEALLFEAKPPKATYWTMQTYISGWFTAGDYAHRVTSLNNAQTFINNDGKMRYVLSKQDPGIQNWIDTEGRQQGSITYRIIWGENAPEVTSKVIKIKDLNVYLPKDTPAFSAKDRRQQVKARSRHIESRFHL